MEPFDGFAIFPTGPRDGGQGRRHVSPVWWSSDESSFAVGGLDEGPADDFVSGDETEDRTAQQEQSVQTKASNASTTHTAKAEPDTMSCANRLRRQPATVCLYERYLESGGCSNHESREAGAVEQQTISSTAATQDTTEGTNQRSRRSCQLSADMNQPELVKISSGPRRVSAQTLAAMLEAGVWEDRGDNAGQQNAHKANGRTSPSSEDTRTRSSIASEEDIVTAWTGNVAANFGPVQHFKAPNLSPQHAEFLNVHSSSARHESLLLPAGRDISIPRNRTEEQNNLGRLRYIMAKHDSKVKAHIKPKQRSRGQPLMRTETASHQSAKDHSAQLTKISNSRHWREPLGPKEVPRYANSMPLREEEIPAYLLLCGHGNYGGRHSEQRPSLASGSPESRPSRNFELGQAQAVKFSKPGKASVVKISPHRSTSFDFGSLGLAETNLMFSAGAVAKSARRTNVRAEGTRLRGARSSAPEGTIKAESPLQDYRQSRIPRAVPVTGEWTARPYKRQICGSTTDVDRDVRFPELVRRLKANDPVSIEDAAHAHIKELSRPVASPVPAFEQRSTAHRSNYRWTTGGIQPSSWKHKARPFSLDGNASQSRIANGIDSPLTSPSKIPANPNPPPGNSGCPSLISDDGQEPCDFLEAVADQHARLPILQGQPRTPRWEKEDSSTALNETSSEFEGSSTLVHISMSANELFSMSDNEATHDENIRADEIHAGVGDSSYTDRGWLSRATEAFDTALPLYYDHHDSGCPAQRRGSRRVTGTRPNELSHYGRCAILRWLISTTDAPGTPGMWHESSMGLELLVNAGEYQLRISDDERAGLIRLLNCLSEGVELPPEPSDEVAAFIRSMNLPQIP